MNIVDRYDAEKYRLRAEEARRTHTPIDARFLYAIIDEEGTSNGLIGVVIGTVFDWVNFHGLTDSYTSEEEELLYPIIDELQLAEIMESTFEFPAVNREHVDQFLRNHPLFHYDPEFVAAMRDPNYRASSWVQDTPQRNEEE